MGWVLMAGLSILLGQGNLAHCGWVNSWDQRFEYSCSGNTFLSYIGSVHSNSKEDRLFALSCRSLPVNAKPQSCFWSTFVNGFDEPVVYQCPHDGFITGMSSYHDNGPEDRRFKFRCCRSPEFITYDCSYTGWENEYDQTFYYSVPSGWILKGMVSVHYNKDEDRRFQFEVCKMKRGNLNQVVTPRQLLD